MEVDGTTSSQEAPNTFMEVDGATSSQEAPNAFMGVDGFFLPLNRCSPSLYLRGSLPVPLFVFLLLPESYSDQSDIWKTDAFSDALVFL